MIKLIAMFCLGFFVATYGVSGVANLFDKAVDKVKSVNIKVA
jgi:hypothetical protein